MKRTLIPALSLLLCANAWASGYHNSSLTLYVSDGSPVLYPLDRYKFDKPMIIYGPATGTTPKPELIVFLHGHSATSGPSGDAFLSYAASLGFFGISLDYDYGSDPDGNNNGPREVCGCYTDCYSQFHYMIVNGDPPTVGGIPAPHYSVKDRIKSVVAYLAAHDSADNWGQFLTGGNIAWSKLVLAGHSRGTSLITHLAKFNQVARVVTFAGDHDQLINVDPAHTYGDGSGPPTTYSYGTSNHLAACTFPSYTDNLSPAYLQDNPWTGTAPNNSPWATQRAQCGASPPKGCQYSFSNYGDTTAPYLLDYTDPHGNVMSWGTAVNLWTLGFETLGGLADIGNYSIGENVGWDSTNSHWIQAGSSPGNVGDLCGTAGSDPHDDAISDNCATTAATKLTHKLWKYMLTNPN